MSVQSQPYYLYLLKCSDGSYYTGIAKDLTSRLEAHQEGKGSKYVASRLPFTLVYQEELESRSAALKREIVVKKLTHKEKRALL